MAAHERRTTQWFLIVVLVTLTLLSSSTPWVGITTSVQAMEMSPDGEIDWDPLPEMGEFKSDADAYKTDNMRPRMLADMARGWVDFVQPQGFPIGKL